MKKQPSLEPAAPGSEPHWGADFMASIVVFLVALPLCMGIAIASGVPPEYGIATGIIGGVVVGFFSGQPLQVSGPAAGLAVMTWQLIQDFGLPALGVAVLIAGALQIVAGVLGLGRWFRAVSPALIQGMLAGIGVLIIGSQFHVMVDDAPLGDGLDNLLGIPAAVYKSVLPSAGSVHHMAAGIGILTILSIVLWSRYRPFALRVLPAPLVGVLLAVGVTALFGFPIAMVSVPDKLSESFNWISTDSLSLLRDSAFWVAAVGMSLIASAETLLSATAVDRIHSGPRTNYDKELRGQGIGNMLCGVIGVLPMTGVIVRSSANIEAGGKTKWSTIFHGAWILILVVAFPQVLAVVPTASLAAILVFTGWKLLSIPAARALAAMDRAEFGIWAATVVTIVATDLLVGVAVGLVLSLARLLLSFAKLDVLIEKVGKRYQVELVGAATFLSIPKLAEALESIPADAEVDVHVDRLGHIDHACMEVVESWNQRHQGKITMEMDQLRRQRNRLQSHLSHMTGAGPLASKGSQRTEKPYPKGSAWAEPVKRGIPGNVAAPERGA